MFKTAQKSKIMITNNSLFDVGRKYGFAYLCSLSFKHSNFKYFGTVPSTEHDLTSGAAQKQNESLKRLHVMAACNSAKHTCYVLLNKMNLLC